MKKYIALTALPLGVLVALICYYAVDLPCWDEYDYIMLIDELYKGTLKFADIFAQHNEHRIIPVKLIILANAVLAHWNIWIELALNVIFATGTSIIIFRMIESIDNLTSIKKAVIYFTSAFLIFSFRQHENWLWGFQMQIFICVFFAVFSAFMLTREGAFSFITAVFSGIIASFSFANGLMIWPAGFIAFFIQAYMPGQKNIGKIVIWLISGIITMTLYFYDFEQVAEFMTFSEKIRFIITHPHIFMILFTSYFAAPVSEKMLISIAVGVLGFLLQGYSIMILIRNKQWKNYYLFWILIDLFIILSGAVTSFGRIDLGIRATTASRYISFSMLFWICTISMFAHALEMKNHNISVRIYIALACVILISSVSGSSLFAARERNEALNVFKSCMLKGEYDSEIFSNVFTRFVYPNREVAKRINLYRKYAIRNFENAQPVNDEAFNDFTEIELNTDAFIHGSNDFKVESFKLIDKEFFSLKVWYKFKAQDCSIILYGNDKAFIAPMHKSSENRHLGIVKHQNPYDIYTRSYFSAEWLYYFNLPEGTYNIAIKFGDKYYSVEGITIAR